MSIQQNINQTLSLASYIGTQIKMADAAKKAASDAAAKAEYETNLTAAKTKYEETKASLLEHQGIAKKRDEWYAAKQAAIKAGQVVYNGDGQVTGQWARVPKELEMGKQYEAELLKRRKAHLASAEDYATYGPGLVKPQELAELRGYIAEAEAGTTEPEITQKKAMKVKGGKTRIEQTRLTGGNV